MSMAPYLSPLRYPGGKGILAEFISHVLDATRPRRSTYFEPFAGGSGVGLYLLFNEHVQRIVLNDLDPGIAAFWRSVFRSSEELVELVRTCDLSVDAWRQHWQTYKDGSSNDLELGFSTLFLNRTNRSGILTARPIGGLEQRGRWKIDARFNRSDLAARILRIARYANRVEILEQDALQLLQASDWLGGKNEPFIYADPPYLSKGSGLYLNSLGWDDHLAIARQLSEWGGGWIVTYDHDERVPRDLYPDRRCAEYSLSHSASTQRFGKEYMVFSDCLQVDTLEGIGPRGGEWVPRGGEPMPRRELWQSS